MKYQSFTAENITDFDPQQIFLCGQCFRWTEEEDGSFTGAAMGKIANIRYRKKEKELVVDCSSKEEFEQIWKPYLDLERDYGKIKEKLVQNDEVMKRAVAFGSGIRILKQDLWETILSFIISQNNNIP
ncbi:MAG: DNA glycosylase, partial [Anaerovoracaceae bacterium]